MNPQSSKAERELARAVIECACRCRGATAYAQNVVDLLSEALGCRLCLLICWESGEPVPLAWTAGAQPLLPDLLSHLSTEEPLPDDLVAAPIEFHGRLAGAFVISAGCDSAALISAVGTAALAQFEALRLAESLGIDNATAMRSTLAEIAHDVRQPLSIILMSTFHLSLLTPRRAKKALQLIENIRVEAERANTVLSTAIDAFENQPLRRPASRASTNATVSSGTY